MAVAVITGSTRGIGFGLAREFLKRGHTPVVSGRTQAAVDEALAKLNVDIPDDVRAIGLACDVADRAQVQALWDFAIEHCGRVDYWINNAGLIHKYKNVVDLPPEDFANIVNVNVTGLINGTQVAVAGMADQPGGGWIYNMEGFGSDGMTRPGISIYGTTKRAITYFTASAIKELKDSPVNVGYLQPGIVLTDLGMGETKDLPKDERRKKKFLMILGDTVEDVTDFLVSNILRNQKHGKRIAWLTVPKILLRAIKQPFAPRDPMSKAGY